MLINVNVGKFNSVSRYKPSTWFGSLMFENKKNIVRFNYIDCVSYKEILLKVLNVRKTFKVYFDNFCYIQFLNTLNNKRDLYYKISKKSLLNIILRNNIFSRDYTINKLMVWISLLNCFL